MNVLILRQYKNEWNRNQNIYWLGWVFCFVFREYGERRKHRFYEVDMSINVFKCPVMVLPFNNCELHCCSMDGYKDNGEALLRRLYSIDDYFASKSKVSRYRIWFNVDDSILTDDIIECIAKSLYRINDNIIKIAFIGTNRKKRRFEKILSKTTFNKPVCYFSDAELAKEWLV